MSVQKITAVAHKNKSLKQNIGVNSNFLSGISFKGYTKDVVTRNGHSYPDPHGTSGRIGSVSTISERDIEHSEETEVINGYSRYETQNYDIAIAKVYYADPGEEITPAIMNAHSFIVQYKKISEPIQRETIEKADKVSELKQIITDIEKREKTIEVYKKKRGEDLKIANEQYTSAKKRLEQADKDFKEIEEQSKLNKELLEFATAKYEKLKKAEEEEFKVREIRSQLQGLKEQLDSLDLNIDLGLDSLKAKIQEYFNNLKG